MLTAIAPLRKNVGVELKSKSFRMDPRVSTAFGEHCQAQGILIERTAEALLVYALSLDAEQIGALLKAAQEWKATAAETEGTRAEALGREVAEGLDRARRHEKKLAQPRRDRKAGGRGA